LQPENTHVNKEESVFEIRKTRGGAILDASDTVKSVLNDDDFVSVGMLVSSLVGFSG
jgi:histidine ammonia-lyase